MNTTILNKCIDELRLPSPKIDYILGMLETVVAMSGATLNEPKIIAPIINTQTINDKPIEKTEEELYREKMLGGRIADTSIDTIISLN